METKLTCFEWQYHLAQFMDGTLPSPIQNACSVHLNECGKCSDRYHHYRTLLSNLAGMPRHSLPRDLMRLSRLPSIPKLESLLFRLSQWDRLPWYFRSFFEGVAIVLIVLAGISAVPMLQTFFETHIQHRLNDYTAERTADLIGVDGLIGQADVEDTEDSPSDAADDFIPAESEAPSESDSKNEISHHSRSRHAYAQPQLWRFALKSVTPNELRTRVNQTLVQLELISEDSGISGVQVPGGIEFDLLVDSEKTDSLKSALEALVLSPGETPNQKQENFTWYRVPFKKKIPKGMSKVVIWIAQPH